MKIKVSELKTLIREASVRHKDLFPNDHQELLDLLEPFLVRCKEMGMSKDDVMGFVESAELSHYGMRSQPSSGMRKLSHDDVHKMYPSAYYRWEESNVNILNDVFFVEMGTGLVFVKSHDGETYKFVEVPGKRGEWVQTGES